MPYKDKEVAHQKRLEYYQANRDKAIAYSATWKKSHRDRVNELSRINNAKRLREDPEFREKRKKFCRKFYEKARIKRLILAAKHRKTIEESARFKLRNAIRNGEIIKPSKCDYCHCETENIHGHHPNYEKPLDVIWLCVFCHGEIHGSWASSNPPQQP